MVLLVMVLGVHIVCVKAMDCVFKLLLSKKMKVSWWAIINNILTTYIFTLSLSMTGAMQEPIDLETFSLPAFLHRFLDHEDSMGVDII